MVAANPAGDAMAEARAWKRRAKGTIAPLVFLAITGYFAWNATQGAHGLMAYAQRRTLLAEANADHAAALAERDSWERRVNGLRASHLDLDTLDERSRAMLNLADPNDVIVPYSPKDRLF